MTLFPPLLEALTTLTREIHNPPSAAGHGIVGTLGNTDGLNKAFRTILNPGDNCLFEEHCFGPPTEQCRAMGCGIVPVRLDPKDGLDAEHMDHLLTNWSESHGPKPRVLYTITTGASKQV